MIHCKRTNTRVVISPLMDYPFYNPSLDEDLYLFETTLATSVEAKREASTLKQSKRIPSNYSNDKELQSFIQGYLDTGDYNLQHFKALEVLTQDKLEYDEAVLLSIMYV